MNQELFETDLERLGKRVVKDYFDGVDMGVYARAKRVVGIVLLN